MKRRNGDPTFVDAMLSGLGGPRTGKMLERLAAAIDWDRLAAPVLKLAAYQHAGPGREPWDPMVMMKGLMLARWYDLSDPQLEEQLIDRISFRRFVGLSQQDRTPDETTFVKFRRRLREAGLLDRLFAEVLEQLEAKNLLLRQGTIVDATIIEQSRGHKRDDGTSTRDGEASYTKKHGRTYHGYKTHLASDRSGIVTDYRFTTAKVHDSKCIDELIEQERQAVLADSAYSDKERRARLAARGVVGGIAYKRNRGQKKLWGWQRKFNRVVSSLRAVGELPFAVLKRHMGWRRVRYRGLERNAFDCGLKLIAYNIKRSLSVAPT